MKRPTDGPNYDTDSAPYPSRTRNLVVLHSGDRTSDELWHHVRPQLINHAQVLTIQHQDAGGQGASCSNACERDVASAATSAARVILAGWGSSTGEILRLARALSHPAQEVILIEPILGETCTGTSPAGHEAGDSDSFGFPMTVILPGSAPELPPALRNLITTSGSVREIIAGRSRCCTPLERPDVVVDVIIELLNS